SGGEQTSAGSPIRNPIISEGPGNLKAPENIITTVQAARNIYFTYRTNSLNRILLFAQIDGLLSGNPPYDPQELASAGLAYAANFNDLSARSLCERAALAYWNLINQADNL